METVKKQADTITDLENELAKARKQERAYEEAMEQLQADLDALEQDNAKLKALANNPERQTTTTQVVEQEAVPTEGNLETSYLLEQVSFILPSSQNFLLSGTLRLKHFVALSASCAQRTRSSRAKTCSKRSRRFLRCLNPSLASPHRPSSPPPSLTPTPTMTMSLVHRLLYAPWLSSRSSCIVKSSSTLRLRSLWTCPCSRRTARTASRPQRRGCHARRPQHTSCTSANSRESGWASG